MTRPERQSGTGPTAKPGLSLRGGAIEAISAADLDRKVDITRSIYLRWHHHQLSLASPLDPPVPLRPGRPAKPELVAPKNVQKRSLNTEHGRIALLHALAHIELNAIDLALDIVARFAAARLPASFFNGWMQVAFEEAKHFDLLRNRLAELGASYGDLPAHDGLWQAATDTSNDLNARLAIVPLVLEARGLDITPSLMAKMTQAGDTASAAILDIIYTDEKKHVAIGAKWFRFLCAREKIDPVLRFQQLVRSNFRGQVKPPFNTRARAAAGMTPAFFRTLSATSS